MIGTLTATTGPLEGTVYALGPRTLVGRSEDADIRLAEQAVSRRHALIRQYPDGRYWIGDLASTNGTFLGHEYLDIHCLEPGDEVHLGKTTLVYSEVDQVSELQGESQNTEFRLLSTQPQRHTQELSLAFLRMLWRRERKDARQGARDTRHVSLSELVDEAEAASSGGR